MCILLSLQWLLAVTIILQIYTILSSLALWVWMASFYVEVDCVNTHC
jgi:hypothetical protein